MKKQNDGGPAYPLSLTTTGGDNDNVMDNIDYSQVGAGMSKREVYAKAAMQGLIASGKTLEPHAEGADTSCPSVAGRAVEYADALIKELGE